MSLGWEVVYGGVEVASFSFDERQQGDDYRLDFAGRTVGFASILFPASVAASTVGTIVAGLPMPSLYDSNSAGKLTRHARLTYHQGVAPDVELEPSSGTDADGPTTPIPADSLIDTVDPLSSLLALAGVVEAARSCAGTVRVFDGKRRYDLVVHEPGPHDVMVRSGPYQALAAMRCAMHLNPIGGYPVDPKKMLANNDSVFWVGQPEGLSRPVPIEIAFSGRWGVLRAHLLKQSPVEPGRRASAD